jgi:phosphatidylglycerophosphate synthase
VTLTGAALLLHASLGTTTAQPALAVGVFVAMAVVMLAAIRDRHPFSRFGPANRVTLLRAALAALAASLLLEPAAPDIAWVAVTLTAAVAVLDGVDGWLARRTGISSVFGARFDMETDAFFMFALSLLVWRHDKAGLWVIGIGLMRYLFVAAAWVLPWLAGPLTPTRRGKTVAIMQLVALAFALLPAVPVPISTGVCAAALTTLTWSFAVDVRRLWHARSRA